MLDWLRRRLTDYTPGVGRAFLVCRACGGVVPYYRVHGPIRTATGCRCGHTYVRPATIPEWKAAGWLLWGWLTRRGDPRMPIRQVDSRYA